MIFTTLQLPVWCFILLGFLPWSLLFVLIFLAHRQTFRMLGIVDVIVLLCVATTLFPSLEYASNLLIIPDSVEAVVGAERILALGRYDIAIGDSIYPPLYPLGFSLFVVLPAFVVFGTSSLGNPIFAIWALATLGPLMTYLTLKKFFSVDVALIGVTLVLVIPGYREFAQQIVSPLPAAGMTAAAVYFYCLVKGSPDSKILKLIFGITIMLATACRSLSALLVLPAFLSFDIRRDKKDIALILIAVVVLTIGTLLYNLHVFGTPVRTGYNFWAPIPHDYFYITFGTRYLLDNLDALVSGGFPIYLALSSVGIMSVKKGLRLRLALTVAAAILPPIIFHLFYFFQSPVYFIPALIILSPLAALGTAAIARRLLSQQGVTIFAYSSLFVVLLVSLSVERPPNLRSQVAKAATEVAPKDAIFITGIDPVFLEPTFTRGTNRRVVPVSRNVEYASKVIAPQKLEMLVRPKNNWWEHRTPELLAAGAIDPVPKTALEQLDHLREEVNGGRRLFVELVFVDLEALNLIQGKFKISSINNFIAELQ